MKPAVYWEKLANDGQARTGRLVTPHGVVPTPAFMPVGTRATVKTIDSNDLVDVGADIVLANTYHLTQRPGSSVIENLGGLHNFMAWDKPILTDSGGYQVLSLGPQVNEEGVVFRSSYDGSRVELTPEAAIAAQEELGPDIAMVLDELVALPASVETVRRAMERTLRWAERSQRVRTRADQGVFGIIQGGVDTALRSRSAAETARLGFDGFGIGGLAVGEGAGDRGSALDACFTELPSSKIRYVMGLGDTEGLLDAISRGADIFDCVLPTRLARHGKALHHCGDFSMKRQEWALVDEPIDVECGCPTCGHYSRGYLRHLLVTREPLGARLLTLHNLHYTFKLVAGARRAIETGSFVAFKSDRLERRVTGTQ